MPPRAEEKNIHFRVPYNLWLALRKQYPEKGMVQHICTVALRQYLEQKLGTDVLRTLMGG